MVSWWTQVLFIPHTNSLQQVSITTRLSIQAVAKTIVLILYQGWTVEMNNRDTKIAHVYDCNDFFGSKQWGKVCTFNWWPTDWKHAQANHIKQIGKFFAIGIVGQLYPPMDVPVAQVAVRQRQLRKVSNVSWQIQVTAICSLLLCSEDLLPNFHHFWMQIWIMSTSSLAPQTCSPWGLSWSTVNPARIRRKWLETVELFSGNSKTFQTEPFPLFPCPWLGVANEKSQWNHNFAMPSPSRPNFAPW